MRQQVADQVVRQAPNQPGKDLVERGVLDVDVPSLVDDAWVEHAVRAEHKPVEPAVVGFRRGEIGRFVPGDARWVRR